MSIIITNCPGCKISTACKVTLDFAPHVTNQTQLNSVFGMSEVSSPKQYLTMSYPLLWWEYLSRLRGPVALPAPSVLFCIDLDTNHYSYSLVGSSCPLCLVSLLTWTQVTILIHSSVLPHLKESQQLDSCKLPNFLYSFPFHCPPHIFFFVLFLLHPYLFPLNYITSEDKKTRVRAKV